MDKSGQFYVYNYAEEVHFKNIEVVQELVKVFVDIYFII